MKKLSFEEFCRSRGFELTDYQRKIWESWNSSKRLTFFGRKAGLTSLMNIMNEYELTIGEEMAKKTETTVGDQTVSKMVLPKTLNGNTFAKWLCEQEGGKVQLTIAQSKEAMKFIGIAAAQDPVGVLNVLVKIGKKYT